ncbi:Nucleoside-diphosphate-sugar epimerase [Chitinophaga ginsengisegetis]|uniref:Nucleoside-diphosphate-sugar epimerase n=1 Tax=Chitinophaga ginsengisegetis TaxID=393003 RepID=A0A1T5P5I6_9BACT|nr:NAD-dependent epimerase/dehydratase family protein [Chitinophaga ginsengisegetis]SKD07887.1 Nucleoside-diphosphate-sugar epimerase [Chitinophaga ginsengisegetis]
MRVTIIGGSGFIGSNLMNKLEDGNYDFTNLDKAKSSFFPAQTVIADVREVQSLKSGLQPCDWTVLLAAEHRDDVSPTSLYYDVNVAGTRNVLNELEEKNINRIIFTSSVAVYGLNKENPDELFAADPFNHYGKSKWEAEEVLREWFNKDPRNRTLVIIRPTVVFGPGNRGNVYNLLKQIAFGKFMMIGSGKNKKSMAYVENVSSFIKYCIDEQLSGYHVFNYADKPDLSVNELVTQAGITLNKRIAPLRIPYAIGYSGGVFLDIVAKVLNKKFPISAVRVKKFCATTQFSADKVKDIGFQPPYSLSEGLDATVKNIVKEN